MTTAAMMLLISLFTVFAVIVATMTIESFRTAKRSYVTSTRRAARAAARQAR
jgi:hypothetical protein